MTRQAEIDETLRIAEECGKEATRMMMQDHHIGAAIVKLASTGSAERMVPSAYIEMIRSSIVAGSIVKFLDQLIDDPEFARKANRQTSGQLVSHPFTQEDINQATVEILELKGVKDLLPESQEAFEKKVIEFALDLKQTEGHWSPLSEAQVRWNELREFLAKEFEQLTEEESG